MNVITKEQAEEAMGRMAHLLASSIRVAEGLVQLGCVSTRTGGNLMRVCADIRSRVPACLKAAFSAALAELPSPEEYETP